ncbi:cytochrome c biogenesis CcdA family protein [Haloquadratum walsbyi]|jgi:Cytochrome C biogenesis protein transmembrane region.|uniref:Cytochrome c biogenesis protein n=1 Tax=Haloquadratum walsbyi J07HQW2 TaxID=1238425 RepID=U1NC96_9EURY|nr:cytochrome c biogenesis protein CcdA [Haloquadratum walsbyi]ERG94535.1 MAG: cytochrome c biogenesis protein [Haloquadratum walsbyi J07HQW2]
MNEIALLGFDLKVAGTIGFAAGAGIATFFAPCAFPLLPGYIGYYINQSETSSGLLSGIIAASGAVVMLGIVAGLTTVVGRRLTTALPLFEPFVGAALIGLGMLLWIEWTPATIPLTRRPDSLLGFGIFGAVYAVAAAGCVIPLFLGVVTQAVSLSPRNTVIVLLTYAAGVALPLIGVTLLAESGMTVWKRFGHYTGQIEQIAAGLLVAAGVGQLYLSIVVLDVL